MINTDKLPKPYEGMPHKERLKLSASRVNVDIIPDGVMKKMKKDERKARRLALVHLALSMRDQYGDYFVYPDLEKLKTPKLHRIVDGKWVESALDKVLPDRSVAYWRGLNIRENELAWIQA